MGLKKNFIFFALGKAGEGISGSDRIFIELARVWSKNHHIRIITSSEGNKLCKIQKLSGKNIILEDINNETLKRNFLQNYLFKIYKGIKLGLTLSVADGTFLYSASEFWMDSLPAFIIKLRQPKTVWIATWYQTAPNPLKGFAEGVRVNAYNFSALLYWLMQLPIKPLIKSNADYVIVNNEDERKQFTYLNSKDRVRVLIGAVRLDEIEKWQKQNKNTKKEFDAVFQGRFHPQKGVVELVDIWAKVVKKIPTARLAMIGDGPLMRDVKKQIKNKKLEKNIDLFGYVYDGAKKYRIFSKSKIVVHPAYYDSGGMASAEAMAFSMPAVGFDLKSYESYYPQGMVKVPVGDLDAYSNTVIDFLKHDKKRIGLGKIAGKMVKNGWSWSKRANDLIDSIEVV